MADWSETSIQRHLFVGAGTVLLLAGGVGGWATVTEISSAVIASGAMVVDSNVKKVQHPTGGIVGELLVRDGDRVTEGQVVVRLDDTITRANLAIVVKALNELIARKARLEAERDGIETLEFPPELTRQNENLDVLRIMSSERKLFESRRTARIGQKAQLRQRIAQLKEEIAGLAAQQEAKAQEVLLIERELQGVRELWEKNLIPVSRLTALEREATRLAGERAQLIASIARANGRIAEIELQIIQIDQDLISEVARDLREVEGKIGEAIERKIAAEDQLKRIDIRAPQSGIVHQLAVHTVSGVIGAGDPIMLIVPTKEVLAVEVKVSPHDIDQIKLGQHALLRFTTFNQRTTPELNGTVSRIAADVTTDQRTGAAFYTVRIAVSPEELARLGDVQLMPGMPVEAFVKTGDRSVVSYLLKPLSDQISRAFREK